MRRLLLASTILTACAGSTTDTKPKIAHDSGAATGVENPELAALLTEDWARTMKRAPLWATQLGDHRYDDQIGDGSQTAIAASRAESRAFLKRARAIDAAQLSETDRITRSLYILQIENGIAAEKCHFEKWSISPRGNPITEWNELPELHPIKSEQDAKNYVARLEKVAKDIDTTIENLSLGAKNGWFANAESTRRVVAMAKDVLGKKTEDWALARPAKEHPAIAADVLRIAEQEIRPAFVRYQKFLEETVLPKARDENQSGLVALPFGAECYEARIQEYTTLPMTAKSIHETGLAEIERINNEMKKLGNKLFKTEEMPVILEKLRGDPALYFESAEAIVTKAESALAAARSKIPDYFGTLPKAKCVVRKIPDYEAPFTTIAYYRPSVPDGSKPGEYYVNVYQPKTRPKFEADALAFHESIPGHHLQIAIAQELPAFPAFRKHTYMTVFGEGWALYTEQLADEMGLYATDLDRMGMLSFEAWRAARLVVDTGLHAMGWSRKQAKTFMADHTALALNNIDNEVDRYIVWPGQALGYKVGQLEIWKLRREAEAKLGDRFDIKAFHDVILKSGSVSMPLLRQQVERWVASVEG